MFLPLMIHVKTRFRHGKQPYYESQHNLILLSNLQLHSNLGYLGSERIPSPTKAHLAHSHSSYRLLVKSAVFVSVHLNALKSTRSFLKREIGLMVFTDKNSQLSLYLYALHFPL
jgi:hypothetical protein